MADYYTKASFQFTATAADADLLREVLAMLDTISDTQDFLTVAEGASKTFWRAFPPVKDATANDPSDRLSGLLSLFEDWGWWSLGLDHAQIDPDDGDENRASVWLAGHQVQLEQLAEIVRRCCPETLKGAPIGFQWTSDCSRPLTDGYGGGAVAIFADRVEYEGTAERLDRMLAEAID